MNKKVAVQIASVKLDGTGSMILWNHTENKVSKYF